MPRNVTGGSGHKGKSNAEGSKSRNNRELVDAYLEDIRDESSTRGVSVARVLRKMGSGRMQVYWGGREAIVPMKGGLRGKGKSTVWVDHDSLVLVNETGLSGITHEIVAVFNEGQVSLYKKLLPSADPKLFLKAAAVGGEEADDMFERGQEETEEVDVDNI